MTNRYHLSLSIPDAWLLLDCCFFLRITVAAWSFMYSGAKWGLEVTAAAWTFPIFLVKDTNNSSCDRLMSVCISMQTYSAVRNEVFLAAAVLLAQRSSCVMLHMPIISLYSHSHHVLTDRPKDFMLYFSSLKVVTSPCP